MLIKRDSMRLAFLIIVLAFTLPGLSQIDTIDKKSFTKHHHYKIEYPATWRTDTSGVMGTDAVFLAPLENESDKFSENINIMIQDLTGQNIDLEKYKQITDKQLADLATEPQVFESLIVKTIDKEYFRVTYAITQNKFRLRITSICFIKNEKAYLVTYTAEFDKYDQYKTTAQAILNSFRLTN